MAPAAGTGPVEAPLCSLNPTLSETMLNFAPGELSTLVGGQVLAEGNLDLHMHQPGQPYRPV